MKIGILGLGAIASCVATDLARQGHELVVSVRSRAHSEKLQRDFPTVEVAENQRVVAGCDLLIIGLTGAVAESVLAGLDFPVGLPVVSLMADIDHEHLSALIGAARLEATMIPFPWIAWGRSPVLVLPETAILQQLFAERHDLVAVSDETALRSYLTLQAVLSPTLKLLETARDWMGDTTDDNAQAETFLRMLVGSALMLPANTEHKGISDLLVALNTPGGYNQRLRTQMDNSGAFSALRQGLDQLRRGDVD